MSATEHRSVSPAEGLLWYESGHLLKRKGTDDAVEWLEARIGRR